MAIEIDPLDMVLHKDAVYREKIKGIIEALLKQSPEVECFYYKDTYEVLGQKYRLKNSLIRHRSNRNPDKWLYEILKDRDADENPRDAGNFGYFVDASATIKLDPFSITIYDTIANAEAIKASWIREKLSTPKKRGVKVLFNTQRFSLLEIENEAKEGGNSPLKTKPPTQYGKYPAIVMHKLGKVDLLDLIYRDQVKLEGLQLFEILIALFEAYLTEFIDKDRIHGDIKPNNIRLDVEGEGPAKVWIIDYSYVKKRGKSFEKLRGTKEYFAPEFDDECAHHTQKSDIWALMLCALELLTYGRRAEFDSDKYNTLENYFRYLRRSLRSLVDGVKTSVDAAGLKNQIYDLLLDAMAINPEERLDPADLKERIKEIKVLFALLKDPELVAKSLDMALSSSVEPQLIFELKQMLPLYAALKLTFLSPQIQTKHDLRFKFFHFFNSPDLTYKELAEFFKREIKLNPNVPDKLKDEFGHSDLLNKLEEWLLEKIKKFILTENVNSVTSNAGMRNSRGN